MFETYTTEFELISQLALLDDLSIDVLMYNFQWSPDGTKLAILIYGLPIPPNDTILQIWDTATARKLFDISGVDLPAGVAWAPDSTRFAAQIISGRNETLIRTYDTQTGQILLEITPPMRISQLAWSPVGNQLVFQGPRDVQVWSADTGQQIRTLNAWMDSEIELAFSPIENLIAFVNLNDDESVIEIWNTDSGQLVHQLQGHTARVIGFAWNTSGLISTGGDNTIRIWDTQTGQQIRSFQVGRYPFAALSADGTILLVEDGTTGIHTRDAETEDILAGLVIPKKAD